MLVFLKCLVASIMNIIGDMTLCLQDYLNKGSLVTVAIAFILAEYGLALSNTARKDLVATFSGFISKGWSGIDDGMRLARKSP